MKAKVILQNTTNKIVHFLVFTFEWIIIKSNLWKTKLKYIRVTKELAMT